MNNQNHLDDEMGLRRNSIESLANKLDIRIEYFRAKQAIDNMFGEEDPSH